MQIEEGRFYRTRSGNRVGPMRPASGIWSAEFAFEADVGDSVDAWTVSGMNAPDCLESDGDLIELCLDAVALILEEGKRYVTAGGRTVGPLKRFSGFGNFYHKAGDGVFWDRFGVVSAKKPRVYSQDIVSEVADSYARFPRAAKGLRSVPRTRRKRDNIAITAMSALIAADPSRCASEIAAKAFLIADAMLAAGLADTTQEARS